MHLLQLYWNKWAKQEPITWISNHINQLRVTACTWPAREWDTVVSIAFSFTSWRSSMQSHSIDLPIATPGPPHAIASQTQLVLRVTKLRAVHVWVSSTSGCSGVAQGLLLLYRHECGWQLYNRKKHWTRWQQETIPVMHGYVEDMELSHYTSHWRSLMQSMSHLMQILYTQVTGDH